jgi:histidine ammonia-lyase
MQEDHVSMGWLAARKLRRAVDGLTRALVIELLTAARGIELSAPLAPAQGTGAVLAALRGLTSGPGPDRYLAPEIEAAVAFVRDGRVIRVAESVTGGLG